MIQRYTEAYFDVGVVLGEKGEYLKALDWVNKAIAQEPENGRYFYGRAWIYQLSGQKENAIADFRKAAGFGSEEAKKYLEEIAVRTP